MRKISLHYPAFLCFFILIGSTCFSQLHPRRSLLAHLADDRKGVAAATIGIDYIVRREGTNVWFNVSWSRIDINATAGYWYKGQLYKDEIPGLTNLLRTGKATAPTVKFNVYYNEILQDTRTVQISAHNDLGMFTGDQFTLKTTEDKLKNPAWRLEAVEMTGFSNVDWWYKAESLIESYERDKKEKSDYKTLVKQADAALAQKNYTKALELFNQAARNKHADTYPAAQAERVKALLQKEKSATRFEEIMKGASALEEQKNYSGALRQYELAASLGVKDDQAQAGVSRVRQVMNEMKKEEEERIKKLKNEQSESQKLKDEQARIAKELKEKDEELQKSIDEKIEQETKALSATEKKAVEENLKKVRDEQEAEWNRKKRAEKAKDEAEKAAQKAADEKLLDRFSQNMQWDPVLYNEKVQKAERYYRLGLAINPQSALELKKEWWDLNHFMKDFRDDLNEPRRQEAFKKAQQLMHDQHMQFDVAKYYFMEAVQFTDAGSVQHNYLLRKMKHMNDLIDIQKEAIRVAAMGEEMRQENFKAARSWAVINRQRDNKLRSEMAYSHLRQQYLYPYNNTNTQTTKGQTEYGQNGNNVLQKQWEYENRLNAADQQLKTDNLVTGVTSQLALSAMIDGNKKAEHYGEGAMGFNLFAFTGGATFPVVDNTEDNPDYVMSSGTSSLGVMPFTGGFDWWIRRSRWIDIGLSGDLTLGVLPILGYKNFFVGYGGNLKLNLGVKSVKLALEADTRQRSGTYYYDEDVAQQENQFRQNTNLIYTGSFNYSLLRVGGGLHFQLSHNYEDSYLRLLMYAEKPSFYQNYNYTKPVLSFGFQLVMSEGFTMNGAFANNYPAAGSAKYMMRNYSTHPMWSFSIGKTWTITKTH